MKSTIPSKKPKALATIVLLALTLSPISVAAQAVGINSAIKHEVQVRKVNQTELRRAKLKARVDIGDYVTTGSNGVLQILLRDKTNFTVGKNAQATIDRFVYDPSKNASEVALSVTKGAFRFISGKPTRNRKGRSVVKTPVGSIGIRGTIFEGAVGPQAFNIARGEDIDRNAVAAYNPDATLVFLRGPGANTQGDEISGAVDLRTPTGVFPLERAGDAYFVPRRGAKPIGPFPLSSGGLRFLRELFDMTPDRGDSSGAYPSTTVGGNLTNPYPLPGQGFPRDPDDPGQNDDFGDFIDNPGSIFEGGNFPARPNPPERGADAANENQPVTANDRNPNQEDQPPPQ